jgi:beta-lactam-binding protein with PASTA domain
MRVRVPSLPLSFQRRHHRHRRLHRQPAAAPRTQCIVPKLKGKKLGAAKIALRKAHCRVGNVTHKKSTRKHRNRVLSQRPRPGTHLRKGARVALTIGT